METADPRHLDSGIEAVELPIREGKAAGEATVTYNNDRDYNEALKKDHEYMGHRFRESLAF